MIDPYALPAKPVNRTLRRIEIPASTDLRPLRAHVVARGKLGIFFCETRAGRPRSWHDFDRDGVCIHCTHQDGDMDQTLGSRSA